MKITQAATPIARVSLLILAILLAPPFHTHADVTATAGVPNGMTNFPGIIQWTLNNPGDSPTFFEIDINPGMTGNNVVTSMESEVDAASGFQANVSGNVMTVDGVIGNLGIAPGEVDMEWEVTIPPGEPIPHPNFPLSNAPLPGDLPMLALFIAAPDGSAAPILSNGTLVLEYSINNTFCICKPVDFYYGTTTAELNAAIDESLRDAVLPPGVEYAGLNNGFPTFCVCGIGLSSFSVRSETRSPSAPGFLVGYLLLGPEDAVVTPDSFTVDIGSVDSGGRPELVASDDQYLVLDPTFLANRYQLVTTVHGTSPTDSPTALSFSLEANTSNVVGSIQQTIELYDYNVNGFVIVDTRNATATDSVVSLTLGGNPQRFVQAGTGAMRARLSYQNRLPFWVFRTVNLFLPFETRIDQTIWTITP